MVDIEKTISSETGSDRILNMKELKERDQALEVLQKVLAELETDGSRQIFLSIMEKLIDIYDLSRDEKLVNINQFDYHECDVFNPPSFCIDLSSRR